MFEDAVYTSRSYTVLPGHRIILYSDGAYEDARVDSRRMNRSDFSVLCTRLAGSPLDDLVETLRALTPSGSFDDDCSLVRLEFD
jgi:serine phosphatase RsbU (regulator of sigma subunit)